MAYTLIAWNGGTKTQDMVRTIVKNIKREGDGLRIAAFWLAEYDPVGSEGSVRLEKLQRGEGEVVCRWKPYRKRWKLVYGDC